MVSAPLVTVKVKGRGAASAGAAAVTASTAAAATAREALLVLLDTATPCLGAALREPGWTRALTVALTGRRQP
jgi:hypothetical protein